ncbi:helix-turn-helix domain-containing protein [Lysinibacillus xylanilyticus]|uniref:helix-turn-helix domain-containing protein n=1 Tax=Lysinibacillus xylanilyticus TaxID=582475 RepID=UPI0037F3363D
MENTFGEIVHMRRNALGMSMRELAKRIGVDVAYISKIEKGKTLMPSFAVVMHLSRELGIKMQTLQNVFGLDSSIEATMKDSEETNFLEKKLIGDLVGDVTDIIENPQLDTGKIGLLLDKILQFHTTKYMDKKVFHIITIIEENWIYILKTPFIDSQLLTLYHQVIEVNEDHSFVIEGDILQLPQFTNKSLIKTLTLQDLLDKCNSIDKNDDFYDEHLELKQYLESNLFRWI